MRWIGAAGPGGKGFAAMLYAKRLRVAWTARSWARSVFSSDLVGSSATASGCGSTRGSRRAVVGDVWRHHLLLELLILLFEHGRLVELGIGFDTCLRCHVALFLDILAQLAKLLLLSQEGRF